MLSQPLTETLYVLCALLLSGGSIYLSVREGKSPVARWFIGVCLSLLAWLVTLFLFARSDDPSFILSIGRFNFASVSLAAFFGWRFVRAVAGRPRRVHELYQLYTSLALSAVAAFTPWIDKAELVGTVTGGHHTTVYGALFPLYVLHIVGLLAASIWTAFRSSSRLRASDPSRRRDQLLLLGWGILSTSIVGIVSNVVLPYVFEDFRWIDLGPLSTLLFLLAVGYAIVRHQLFDIRVFVRRTLVLGAALSLVLAAYSALVLLATDRFASSESGGLTRFGVLVLAFSFDPVRRFLEKSIDRLLFPVVKRRPARG